MKNKPFIFIAIFLLIAVPAAIFFYKKSKEENEETEPETGTKTGTKKKVAASEFPLKKGSVSAKVKNLQQLLNKFALAKLDDDGKFGQITEDAVYRWFKTKTVSEKQYSELNAKALYSLSPNPNSQSFTPGGIMPGSNDIYDWIVGPKQIPWPWEI